MSVFFDPKVFNNLALSSFFFISVFFNLGVVQQGFLIGHQESKEEDPTDERRLSKLQAMGWLENMGRSKLRG